MRLGSAVFEIQLHMKIPSDWASTYVNNLKHLNIKLKLRKYMKKTPQRRDNAGAVCNSRICLLNLVHLDDLNYLFLQACPAQWPPLWWMVKDFWLNFWFNIQFHIGFNIGWNIQLNIWFNIHFNIWLKIQFNIRLNIVLDIGINILFNIWSLFGSI